MVERVALAMLCNHHVIASTCFYMCHFASETALSICVGGPHRRGIRLPRRYVSARQPSHVSGRTMKSRHMCQRLCSNAVTLGSKRRWL